MRNNNWKNIMMVSACMTAALALSACGSDAAGTTASPDATEAKTTEAQTAVSTEAAAKTPTEEKTSQTKPLVVYLNDFDAVIPDMFKKATGYDVEGVVGNGAETMSRIAAEKGNPQGDVVWIDSMYDVYFLSQDGELVTDWEPENAANTSFPPYGCLGSTFIPVSLSYVSTTSGIFEKSSFGSTP